MVKVIPERKAIHIAHKAMMPLVFKEYLKGLRHTFYINNSQNANLQGKEEHLYNPGFSIKSP